MRQLPSITIFSNIILFLSKHYYKCYQSISFKGMEILLLLNISLLINLYYNFLYIKIYLLMINIFNNGRFIFVNNFIPMLPILLYPKFYNLST